LFTILGIVIIIAAPATPTTGTIILIVIAVPSAGSIFLVVVTGTPTGAFRVVLIAGTPPRRAFLVVFLAASGRSVLVVEPARLFRRSLHVFGGEHSLATATLDLAAQIAVVELEHGSALGAFHSCHRKSW